MACVVGFRSSLIHPEFCPTRCTSHKISFTVVHLLILPESWRTLDIHVTEYNLMFKRCTIINSLIWTALERHSELYINLFTLYLFNWLVFYALLQNISLISAIITVEENLAQWTPHPSAGKPSCAPPGEEASYLQTNIVFF